MGTKLLLLSLLLGILFAGVMVASAATLNIHESDLPASYGEAYQANLGSDGNLYIIDRWAKQIIKVDSTGAQATVYQPFVEEVVDAKPDGNGDIWFSDGAEIFGQIDISENQVYLWEIDQYHNLGGVAFDSSGKVWLSEWFGDASKLYSFNPAATELCTYTLPMAAGTSSYYLVEKFDALWLLNWRLGRVYHVNPGPLQASWWQLPNTDSPIEGISIDNNGNIWWADEMLDQIAKLDPTQDQLTVYDIPKGKHPKMVHWQEPYLYYTEEMSGTIGILDPTKASGTSSAVTKSSSSMSAPTCATLASSDNYEVDISNHSFIWSGSTLDSLVDDTGWQIYQLPTGANPYGIVYFQDDIWVVDQGRQKAIRFEALKAGHLIYLPLVVR